MWGCHFEFIFVIYVTLKTVYQNCVPSYIQVDNMRVRLHKKPKQKEGGYNQKYERGKNWKAKENFTQD